VKQLSDKTIELEESDAGSGAMSTLVAKVRANLRDKEHLVIRQSSEGGPLKQYKKDGKVVAKDTPGAREVTQRVFVTTDPKDPKLPKSQRGGALDETAKDILAKLRG
jgi:hypothetical protein